MRLSCAMMATLAVSPLGGASSAQTSAGRPPVPGAPAGVTAFVNVGVVPMDSERTLEHQTVLVRDGRIAALGPAATISVPPGAVRIQGRGRYLMPGLGACHGHLSQMTGLFFPRRDPRYAELLLFRDYLAKGVTVVRDVEFLDLDKLPMRLVAHSNRQRLWLRAEAAAGQLWSPRLYLSGQWGPNQYVGWPKSDAFSNPLFEEGYSPPASPLPAPRLDSIAAYVAAFKAEGFDFLKLHDESAEIADSVLAAARRIGLPVGGHMLIPLERALARGQHVEDHASGGATDAGPRARAGMWNCDVDLSWGGAAFIRGLVDSGAGILLGTDGYAQDPGSLVIGDSGLTPYEALATGTKNYGRYLQTLDPHGDETGTIDVGQRADLVLLRGNPLKDMRYVSDLLVRPPELVMIGGRWLAGSDLRRRVATMATYTALRQDWVNLLHDLLGDSSLTAVERQAVVHLDSLYQEQQFVLAEPFVLSNTAPAGGADSLRGPQALVTLFAQQLGGLRTVLGPMTQERFDATARAWLAQHAHARYRVTIAGVQRSRCGPTPLAALEFEPSRSWPPRPQSPYGAIVERRPCASSRRASPSSSRGRAP